MRNRKPPSRWGYAYVYSWFGLMTVWMLWALVHSHGWRQLVTALVVVGDVASLWVIDRNRRRLRAGAATADATEPSRR